MPPAMRCRLAAMTALLVAACATMPPPAPAPGVEPVPPTVPGTEPAPVKPQAPPTRNANPPANVNLQGFPLSYRQGYADGCASVGDVEHKDAARFRSDGQYRTGWQDGHFLCRKK